MHLPEIETDRLRLRPCTSEDIDALHRLWTDPDVRRYLWDDEVISRDVAAATVQQSIACFATRGFGQWTVRLTAVPELIGFCGYRPADDTDVELMYGLAPAHWRRGLATEAATAVLRYAFAALGLSRILASTDPPNVESVRVLERLGMRFQARQRMNEHDLLCYALARDDFHPPPSTYWLRTV